MCSWCGVLLSSFFFFFNDTATTEIYTLSLHDALPICRGSGPAGRAASGRRRLPGSGFSARSEERFSRNAETISYAVFCLKKKKKNFKALVLNIVTGSAGRAFSSRALQQ